MADGDIKVSRENSGSFDEVKAQDYLLPLTGGTLTGNVYSPSFSTIKDKKWVIFGDSFSYTLASGYPYYVIQKTGMTGTVTHGVSGHRWDNQKTVLDGLIAGNANYFDDFDIVSILLGANDFAGNWALGTFYSAKTDANVAGYIKYFIETILTSNPNIKLYIMTSTEGNGMGVTYKAANSLGWTLNDLSVLIGQIAAYYSVEVIDLYSLSEFNLLTIPTYTSDNLHPNAVGAEKLATIIANSFSSSFLKGRLYDPKVKVTTPALDITSGIGVALTKLNSDGTIEWGAAADYGLASWYTGKAIIRGKLGKALSLGANNNDDKIYIKTDGNVGINNNNPTVLCNVGAGSGSILTVPNGAGSNLAGQLVNVPVSGFSAVVTGVNDATNNWRASLFINPTNELWGLSQTASSYGIPFVLNMSGTERLRVTTAGKFGFGTTAPDKQVEINSSDGNNLRLTYNDSNGSAANYVDFLVSSSGDLTITPSGGDLAITGNVAPTGNIQLAENASLKLDPGLSADGKYSGVTILGTGGTTIAFGDLITLDKDDSRWEKVDISVAAAATGDARGILGMAVTASEDGDDVTVLLMGNIRADANFPTLTIGAHVWASTTGDVVVARPTTTDYVQRVIGQALSTDELFFNPSADWQIQS